MKLLTSIIILPFLAGCEHPEGKAYERNQGTSSRLDYIESIKSITDHKTASAHKDFDEIRRTESSRVWVDNINILPMENQNGVKYVWIEVNGIRLRFIFDTGASSICISPAEANVLYRQGTLRMEDILNKEYFQDATGRVSEGTKVNLRNVKIGSRILQNVEATVVDNISAPLLLGQSVLENFGKIEIDNENGQIVFR